VVYWERGLAGEGVGMVARRIKVKLEAEVKILRPLARAVAVLSMHGRKTWTGSLSASSSGVWGVCKKIL
jgi:hypothetical protein